MSLHDEVYARYQEVHESHCGYGTARGPWMRRYSAMNIEPHIPYDALPPLVLEIACGAGDLMDAMKAHGYCVVGTDLCPENVDHCRDKGFSVWSHDVFAKPLPMKFNAIVSMGLIEHLPKETLLPALRAIKTMLAPGGVVIFGTQNMDAPIGVHYRYLDITHELGFTHESLAQVGRLVFPRVSIHPMVYPQDAPRTVKQHLVARVRPWYKRLYRAHLRLMQTPVIDTWYEAPGLVGVFRAD